MVIKNSIKNWNNVKNRNSIEQYFAQSWAGATVVRTWDNSDDLYQNKDFLLDFWNKFSLWVEWRFYYLPELWRLPVVILPTQMRTHRWSFKYLTIVKCSWRLNFIIRKLSPQKWNENGTFSLLCSYLCSGISIFFPQSYLNKYFRITLWTILFPFSNHFLSLSRSLNDSLELVL